MLKLWTGKSVPALGLGTWQAKPGQVLTSVKAALASNYRHIDSAAVYGTEGEVGKAVKESAIARDQLFLSSKLWNSEHEPQRVRAACERSLKALQTDYMDLYLLHWPLHFAGASPKEWFDSAGKLRLKQTCTLLDTWRAMEQLVDAGLCKHIGVSNFTREHLDQILPHCRIKPAMNQIELHPYLPQNELVEYCRSHGILCTAYSPLGSGQSPKLLQDPVIKQVAERRQASAAQVLISWALQRGTVCIPKSITPERIKENAKVIRLTEDDMQAINGIQRRHRYISPAKFWRHRVFPDESEPVPLKK